MGRLVLGEAARLTQGSRRWESWDSKPGSSGLEACVLPACVAPTVWNCSKKNTFERTPALKKKKKNVAAFNYDYHFRLVRITLNEIIHVWAVCQRS